MNSFRELAFPVLLGLIFGLANSPTVLGTHLTLHESRIRSSVPLTEENFERAKLLKSEDVLRKYPIGTGAGPLRPRYITNGVEGPQTKVGHEIVFLDAFKMA